MGGAYARGNITPAAEFNIYPDAADVCSAPIGTWHGRARPRQTARTGCWNPPVSPASRPVSPDELPRRSHLERGMRMGHPRAYSLLSPGGLCKDSLCRPGRDEVKRAAHVRGDMFTAIAPTSRSSTRTQGLGVQDAAGT